MISKHHIYIALLMLMSSWPYLSEANQQQIYTQKDITAVLKKAYTAIKSLQSLSYDITYSSKSYTSNDTFVSTATGLLKYDPSIKLGTKLALDIQYYSKVSKTVRYNGQYAAIHYTDSSGHVVNKLTDVNKEGINWFYGSSIQDYAYNHIFNPKELKRVYSILYRHFIKSISMTDTLLNDQPCYYIIIKAKNINRPNFEQNSITELIIDKSTYLPAVYSKKGTFEGIDLYDLYVIHFKSINMPINDAVFQGDINALPEEEHPAAAVAPVTPSENTSSTAEPDIAMATLPIPTISGDTIVLSQYAGKVVVLDFWYRTCLPCLKLMPEINRLQEQYKDREVLILGINDIDDQESVREYFRLKGYTYSSSYKNGYNFSSFAKITQNPTTIIIGKDGKVAATSIGYGKKSFNELKKAIEKALQEK